MSCADNKACKLCHGPIAESAPSSPLSATGPAVSDCHTHCMGFACPGCVAKHRDSYQIINLKNHIYDYHCGSCMADVQIPQSRRGSVESNVDPIDTRQAMF